MAMSLFARARTMITIVPREITTDDTLLTPAEVRSGLKLSLIEGMFAQAHNTISIGAFLTGFALLLGAGNLTLGIVGALPFLIQPLQLLGAWLIERLGRRKPLAVAGSLGRALWLALLLLPYVPLSTAQRLWLLVLTLFAAHALLALCSNAWTHWMTDLVPARLRGRYFGTRNTALAAVAMAVNTLAGFHLDRMRQAGRIADGYALIFGVAVLCGAVATILLSRQPEPPLERRSQLRLADLLQVPWRTPAFRRFLGALIVWNLALGVATPFFSAHALQVLHLPFTTLALLDATTAGISLLTLSLWGQIADRFGQRRVLLACMTGVLILPWFWVIATPAMMWPLYVNAVISGIWWPGLNLALANRLMEQVPVDGRGAYLAVFAATTGLAFFVASALAGGAADLLVNMQWSLGGLAISNYQTLFIVSSLLRASVVLFWRKAL